MNPPPLPSRKPICYGYIRVSDPSQVESGLSLEAQRRLIAQEYRTKRQPLGYLWGGIFEDDAVSAFTTDFFCRPAGCALMARIRKGDHVVFTKFDRVFRRTKDSVLFLNWCEEKGIGFTFMDLPMLNMGGDEGPIHQAIAGMFAALAQVESQRKSTRQHEIIAIQRATGRPCARWPYGYWIPKGCTYLEPDPLTIPLAQFLVALRERGKPKMQQYIDLWKLRAIYQVGHKSFIPYHIGTIKHAVGLCDKLGLPPISDQRVAERAMNEMNERLRKLHGKVINLAGRVGRIKRKIHEPWKHLSIEQILDREAKVLNTMGLPVAQQALTKEQGHAGQDAEGAA